MGRDRVQIAPWKASSKVANLIPFPARESLPVGVVYKTIDEAVGYGFTSAYTAALSPNQAWSLDGAALLEASARYNLDNVLVGRFARLATGHGIGLRHSAGSLADALRGVAVRRGVFDSGRHSVRGD